MVQETIKVVKETEAKAEQIVKDAVRQADALIEKANEDAALLRENAGKAARQRALSELEEAKGAAAAGEQDALREVEKEIQDLRKQASQKEARAIELVVDSLF